MAIKNFLCSALILLLCCGCAAEQQTSKEPENHKTLNPIISNSDLETELQITEKEETLPLEGIKICIDPGHEITSLSVQEPISPISEKTKEAFVGGASGRNQTEEALNLSVSLLLQDLLTAEGASVIMTRTTHESDMTSYARAQLANEENVNLCIRIHADGSENPSVYGMSMLVPYGEQLANQEIVSPSKVAGELILQATADNTGAKNNGIVNRSDLTGFNFSEVPVILIEMGFMSNAEEDAQMETADYQKRLAEGMRNGILQYFSNY